MAAEYTPEAERALLDKWGGRMAENLIGHARNHRIDLTGMIDAGYNWYEWLAKAFNDDGMTRDLVFWGVSHMFAQEFADRETEPDAYAIRRVQVAQHAIKLIGNQLFQGEFRWERISENLEGVTFDPSITSFERSWPVVATYNGQLITVYFIVWLDRPNTDRPWTATVHAISIEHLTEFDWGERAGMLGRPGEDYGLSEMLFDFIHEGQGAYLWSVTDQSEEVVRQKARQRAVAVFQQFDTYMDTFDPQLQEQLIKRLRAVGGEYTWLELPELRDRYGGGDGKAISKHADRTYQYGMRRYTLSRDLSASPPCFELYFFTPGDPISKRVQIDGQDFWGDGLSWQKAEAIAKQAVHDMVWSKT